MSAASPITASIVLDADGIRHGHLRLPHSHDGSAWGHVMIPITVARNGDGPTALLTGGSHGDEYEGPLALMELANALEPARMAGRVIILPAMNHPAFAAARRTSPIDGGNLNRVFPGAPDGTVTEKIAHYVASEILPRADIVLDIHSGGKTLDFIPFAAIHETGDPSQTEAARAAMEAFGAPHAMIMRELDPAGMFDTVAEQAGKVFVTTELGGGGTATAASVGIARRGVRNLLIHAGIVDGTIDHTPSRLLSMDHDGCFHLSPGAGILEPCRDLGVMVQEGELIARIWPADRTGVAPAEIAALSSGLLAGRHFPGLIAMGDCLAVIARPVG
ncbi:N(2)-acetyl-L-2,4-diaminobutanoate deacetylase DoeB [Oceaniradius stylonematis]|uniref:N(2)-acetyl-L-2,4-diaminobutanoate deacetylase DoeB n=1 Tax=Oceaniradius stylonematis TaxID=2184161 RepID=UPI003C7CC5B7